MILRVWRAQALPENVDAYTRHFRDDVLPALQAQAGHRGAYLISRSLGTHVELQALTLWDSMESIRAFAGAEVDQAVVDPRARAVLEHFDASVQHYDVVLSASGPPV